MSTIALEAKRRAYRHEMARFNDLRMRASNLLEQAAVVAKNAGLGDVYVAQVQASSKIAGARFHHIVGQADAADMHRLRDDLELLERAVDPLIAAVGDEAFYNTPGASDEDRFSDCFKDVLTHAFDGNAHYVLNDCAEAAQSAITDPGNVHDMRRALQEAE